MQKSIEKREVDYRFKILYALAIIMVLTGHSKGGGISLMFDWFPVQPVHLCIFMFASGYFYKQESEENVCAYIWKKVKRLIIPMYIYNLAYGILGQIISINGPKIAGKITWEALLIFPITSGQHFGYNLGGWFIVPLFMVELSNVLIRSVAKKLQIRIPEWLYFVVTVILGMGGVYLASIGYNNSWWRVLVRWLFFLPFYYGGIFYKKILEYHDTLPGGTYFSIIFALKLVVAVWLGKMPSYTPALCNDFVDGVIAPFIVCALGVAFWLRIARVLEPILGRNKYVNLVADNTYSIMMNHILGFQIVNMVYAFVAKTMGLFGDFDWGAYEMDKFYVYTLGGINQTKIIYIIVAIVFSVGVQRCIDKVKGMINI